MRVETVRTVTRESNVTFRGDVLYTPAGYKSVDFLRRLSPAPSVPRGKCEDRATFLYTLAYTVASAGSCGSVGSGSPRAAGSSRNAIVSPLRPADHR